MFDDFRTLTRAKTLVQPIAQSGEILAAIGDCLKRVPLDCKLRLLGVHVTSLMRKEGPPTVASLMMR